jgi:Trypsin
LERHKKSRLAYNTTMTRAGISRKVLAIGLAVFYACTPVQGASLFSDGDVAEGFRSELAAKDSLRHADTSWQTYTNNVKDDAQSPSIYQALKANKVTIVNEERIVGGQIVAKEAFPWYVSSTGDMYCGASLIHEDVVLTAAHCFQAFRPGSVVTLGTHQRVPPDMVQEIEATGIKRTVTAVMPHPFFDDYNIFYDYMLLKLDSPVKSVTPVELNTDDAVPAPDELVTVVGHGQTGFFSGVSIELLAVNLYTIPHEICAMNFAGVSEIDDSIMMCASAPSFGKGPWYVALPKMPSNGVPNEMNTN